MELAFLLLHLISASIVLSWVHSYMVGSKNTRKPYEQNFRKEWLQDPRFKCWLREAPGNKTKARCAACLLDGSGEQKQFNARVADLIRHSETNGHKTNMRTFTDVKQAKIPFVKKDYTRAAIEGSLGLFITEHCPILAADHLVRLCGSKFKEAEHIELKRTRCSGIIRDVLAPHFFQDLVNDLDNGPYSLLMDESNDISCVKMLGLVIRYFSNSQKKIISTFLGLIPLETCDANGITTAMKNFLKENSIQLKNLIGIGTDNASVMTGINAGVYALLKSELPNLTLVRCVCHSLQLAASHAAQYFMPTQLEYLIRETYNWFSHSAIRQGNYTALYLSLNDKNPLKIVRSCNTRWLSISVAVSRILEQWDELKLNFEMAASNEKCFTSQTLFNMYKDGRFKLFLMFLEPVLANVHKKNKLFESATQDATRLLSDLIMLLNELSSIVVTLGPSFDVLTSNIKENLHPRPWLGQKFETEYERLFHVSSTDKNKIPHEKLAVVRKQCIEFVIDLIDQIRQRVPDNIKILRNIKSFSVLEVLKPNQPVLTPELLLSFAPVTTNITDCISQYKVLGRQIWEEKSDTEKFWAEVLDFKNSAHENPFSDIANVALAAICLPHSNADVERAFSMMNLVKSKLRNRMCIGLLNAILTIRFGLKRQGQNCNDYKFSQNFLKSINDYSLPRGKKSEDDGIDNMSLIQMQAEEDDILYEVLARG